jgi:O-antigen ligase
MTSPHISGQSEAVERRRPSEKPARTPLFYQILDWISGGVILAMTIVIPWLFGTVEDWAVWSMNYAGYGLGVLLLLKWGYRLFARYSPPRHGEADAAKWITISVGLLTLLALGYCLTSAINARATFILREQRFDYHDFNPKLPFTYDDNRSWYVFWIYLSLACFFWALRDWLLGKSKRERRLVRKSSTGADILPAGAEAPKVLTRVVPIVPDRLKLLLWVLCINGALVALQGTLQRLSGSSKLLWLRESYWHTAESCFGPYSYRTNAVQYINLIWPVCLGFWWTLNESRRGHGPRAPRIGEGPHLILLPLTVLMAAAPVIATSRGAAVIAIFNLILCALLILFNRRTRGATRIAVVVLTLAIIGTGWFLGGAQLQKRFETLEKDKWSNRGEIYENSKKIAQDFTWFGTGPGTFRSVYQLYRGAAGQLWAAFVHDDWLETRITFGLAGTAILLLLLFLAVSHWFVAGSFAIPTVLSATILIAITGCLVHAKFDFPLQVYSILFVFLLNCCVLFTTSRPGTMT